MNIITKQICIVGSGFCGYAVYKKLSDLGLDIILLEGGTKETPEDASQQSEYKITNNKNIIVNQKNCSQKTKNRLDLSFKDRKYTLGGSSECWTGWIKPFENSTYKNYYDNHPQQQWGELNLVNYEKEVLDILGSPIDDFNPNTLSDSLNLKLPKLLNGLNYSVYAWAENNLRLKQFWKNKLALNHENITQYKNVLVGYKLENVVERNQRISSAIFKSDAGQDLSVNADTFFFCMGGIENARFLIKTKKLQIKRDKKESNLGYFQEHPHFYSIASFDRGKKALDSILQDRLEVKKENFVFKRNGYVKFGITAWDGIGTPKATFEISKSVPKDNLFKFKHKIKSIIGLDPIPYSEKEFIVNMRCEQSPCNTSKLETTNKRNHLNWDINNSDFHYYSKYLKRLASFLITNNLCTNFTISNDEECNLYVPANVFGGCHHMGTVPFAGDNPIINSNFQHLKFKNIYFVGSSSFPISGYENPTHNAIASALAAVHHFKNS